MLSPLANHSSIHKPDLLSLPLDNTGMDNHLSLWLKKMMIRKDHQLTQILILNPSRDQSNYGHLIHQLQNSMLNSQLHSMIRVMMHQKRFMSLNQKFTWKLTIFLKPISGQEPLSTFKLIKKSSSNSSNSKLIQLRTLAPTQAKLLVRTKTAQLQETLPGLLSVLPELESQLMLNLHHTQDTLFIEKKNLPWFI